AGQAQGDRRPARRPARPPGPAAAEAGHARGRSAAPPLPQPHHPARRRREQLRHRRSFLLGCARRHREQEMTAESASGVWFGWDPLWVSTALLVVTYAAIMTERVNRAIVALVGAGLMILTGVLTQQQALAGEDFNTLALLIGMMLLVAIARKSGMFQYLAIWAAKAAKGRPWAILALLSLVTALVSALLDNVTTVLLIAPVTLVITEQLKVPPYPFLFTEILASNIGGTATLIGDPPNIIIGSAAGLSFNDFVVNLTPVIILVMAAQALVNHLIWGRAMQVDKAARARVMAFDP